MQRGKMGNVNDGRRILWEDADGALILTVCRIEVQTHPRHQPGLGAEAAGAVLEIERRLLSLVGKHERESGERRANVGDSLSAIEQPGQSTLHRCHARRGRVGGGTRSGRRCRRAPGRRRAGGRRRDRRTCHRRARCPRVRRRGAGRRRVRVRRRRGDRRRGRRRIGCSRDAVGGGATQFEPSQNELAKKTLPAVQSAW